MGAVDPSPPCPDPQVAAWLQDLRARSRLSSDEIAELRDHLEEGLARSIRDGVHPHQAFAIAIESLGDVEQLIPEFERNRTMKRSMPVRVAALALATLPIAIAGWSVGFSPLAHLPSFLLVSGMIATGLVASFGRQAVGGAFRATSGDAEPVDADVARAVFRRGYQLSWAAGVLGVLFGVVSVLTELSDPAQLGPALAMAISSILYGALFAEVGFRNLEHWVPMAVRVGRIA